MEWLLLARRSGARIGQVPVDFLPRRHGRSTLGAVSTIGPMLGELRRVRRALATGDPRGDSAPAGGRS